MVQFHRGFKFAIFALVLHVKEVALLAVADDGAVFYRPAFGVLVGFPAIERLAVENADPAGIRGQRMDLYFGDDDYALAAAQAMTVQGDAWVLMPK